VASRPVRRRVALIPQRLSGRLWRVPNTRAGQTRGAGPATCSRSRRIVLDLCRLRLRRSQPAPRGPGHPTATGESHERNLDFYRNFGRMGGPSGVRSASTGYFHLNERRLSGDRQKKSENPAAAQALRRSAAGAVIRGPLLALAAASGAAAPAQSRRCLRVALRPAVQNGQEHPENQKGNGRHDQELTHRNTSPHTARLSGLPLTVHHFEKTL
jgi:hypothetical protein